jgi:hypothetical protein
MEEIIT